MKALAGFIIGTAIALLILAVMHYEHIWTLLGFRYN